MALLGGHVAAQSVVWPPGYANTPGNSSQETPFTLSASTQPRGARTTVLMSAPSLTQLVGKTITAIAFRRDHQHSGSYPAFSGQVQIRMGPVHSAQHVVREQRYPFSGPSTRVKWGSVDVPSAPQAALAPFQFVISFDEPYTYQGGDLGLDILFTSQTNATWRRDAVWVDPGTEGRMRTLGSGQPGASGRTPLLAIDSGVLHPGGSIISRAEALPLPAGLPVAQVFGDTAGPFPLAAIGMPGGAFLHVGITSTTLTTSADRATGFARALTTFPIPNDPTLTGFALSTQMLPWDPMLATPFPANVTNGIEFEIGAAPTQGPGHGRTLWARDTNNPDSELRTRIGPVDYVPIIEFRY